MFSTGKLLWRTLLFYFRTHLAVGLGVVAGTAVLTGALLVGDSVTGSLRDLALQRLGTIEDVLVSDRFFRETVAGEVIYPPGAPTNRPAALPMILLPGSVERPNQGPAVPLRRAGQVTVLGCAPGFWSAGDVQPIAGSAKFQPPGDREVVLSAPLANELQVKVGDEVLVRLPEISDIPRDSALGRKTDTVRSQRFKVAAILAEQGLGRFGLNPSQQSPRVAYVDLRTLQTVLRQYSAEQKLGYINAIFTLQSPSAPLPSSVPPLDQRPRVDPQLQDLGLAVTLTTEGYLLLSSRRMLLDASAVKAAHDLIPAADRQDVMTYLANTIASGEKEVPYSTIAALDFVTQPPLGPFNDLAGQAIPALKDDEIVLNAWTADDLQAQPGAKIRIAYFEPESTHGQVVERSAEFTLKAIVPMSGPTLDRLLTPDFPGITDQLSIGDWDPPFPFDNSRVRKIDEDYWDTYRATPKAFVSLATGQKLWGSRFGDVTGMRVRPQGKLATVDEVTAAWRGKLDPTQMGFAFQPLKAEQLQAASGSTPFGILFLAFSMFIIAAAIMLVVLLFQLNVESRASEVGLLLAMGWTIGRVRWQFILEGLVIALFASLLGAGLGVAYAQQMLALLSDPRWWHAAINTPFLELHITAQSLVIGYVSGVILSAGAIAFTVWRMGRVSVRNLIANQMSDPLAQLRRGSMWSNWLGLAAVALALLTVPLASGLNGMAQAGAFFGGGSLLLAGLLLLAWGRLNQSGGQASNFQWLPLETLAFRNAARNAGRSVLTCGLVASATFLIVAVSAFRIDPALMGIAKNSGNGGFAFVAASDQPVLQNPNAFNTPEGQDALNLTDSDVQQLAGSTMFACRVRPGDDASCLNLYQATSPRVLGLPQAFIARGGFAWAGTAANTPDETANPWLLLNRQAETVDGALVVPAILDAATAQYGLKIGLGSELAMTTDRGQPLKLRVVGLLDNSIVQGDMLISEANFLRAFPDQSGYRFFFLEAPAARAEKIAEIWENAFGDFGFDAESSTQRLSQFLAVQNTYLLTFQSLGGLGLLLGTFGLAAVQLRNVLERRSELALLRATGFRPLRLARLVLTENALLLGGGLGIGLLAAVLAIWPQLLSGRAALDWFSLGVTLGLVIVVGAISGARAVFATLRAPIMPALRKE